MRRILAGSLVVAALLVGTPAGPATADTTSAPGSLTTVDQQTGPLTVTIPPGTTPSAVTGVLTMPAIVEGSSTTILVNGRAALTVPSTLYAKISIPLLPTDVTATGTLDLTLRHDPAPGTTTCEPAPATTLRKLGLEYTGTETPPSSVATFFPQGAARIDVQVPSDADDDVLQAALDAVAALSHRYGADTPVELSTTDTPLPSTGAGQRVVRVTGGGGDVSTTIDPAASVPTLVLAGGGLPLADAASALGTADLAVSGGASTTDGLSRQVETRDDGPTRTFAQLRQDSPPTASAAAGTDLLQIRQDSFGTPVSSLAVHLEGTHSAVAEGSDARLDVYLDDQLIGSSVLGPDPTIDLDLTIPGSSLRTTDLLRATITSATSTAAGCTLGLPLELSLDDTRSTVTATAGGGDTTDFQLFPQAFGGILPVAIRPAGEARIEAAIDAAVLVSTMQRQAAAPLDITIVDPDVLLQGNRSGLLIGADYDDSATLNAPLRLSGTKLQSSARATFEVGSDAPFAALESVGQGGRRVLVLGSWAPGDTVAPPTLLHRLTTWVSDTGWQALDGDVVVADATGSPYAVDSGTTVTTPDENDEGRSYAPWFAACIALLLLLLALQVVLAVRRDRRGPRAGREPRPDAEPRPTEEPRPSRQVRRAQARAAKPAAAAEPVADPSAGLPATVATIPDPEPEPEPAPEPEQRVFGIFRRNPAYREEEPAPAVATDEPAEQDDLDVMDDPEADELDELKDVPPTQDVTLSRGRQPWVHLRRP